MIIESTIFLCTFYVCIVLLPIFEEVMDADSLCFLDHWGMLWSHLPRKVELILCSFFWGLTLAASSPFIGYSSVGSITLACVLHRSMAFLITASSVLVLRRRIFSICGLVCTVIVCPRHENWTMVPITTVVAAEVLLAMQRRHGGKIKYVLADKNMRVWICMYQLGVIHLLHILCRFMIVSILNVSFTTPNGRTN